jgi:hypothetical protein
VQFRQIIHDLVEAAGNEIGKLHLNHALVTAHAEPQADTHDGRLAERRPAHPVPIAKLLHKALRDFLNTPPVRIRYPVPSG